jgi:hypothetical protein
MKTRVTRRRTPLIPFLLLGAFRTADSSTTSSTSAGTSHTVDLSYLHNLPAASLKNTVQDHAKGEDKILLNLSHSSIGDKGIQEILSEMLGQGGLASAQLDLSMNRLTPVGVNWLFHKLLEDQSQDDDETNSTSTSLQESSQPLTSLNLSWNYLATDVAETTRFHDTLEKLVAHHKVCPTELCFDSCSVGPAFCRALGQGLIHRYIMDEETEAVVVDSEEESGMPPLLVLSLCGNADIGDAGTAALAAALRTIVTSDKSSSNGKTVLERLDLSSCGIGNVGAEALALALEDGCGVNVLDLSNNQLSDEGVAALGRAIALAEGCTVRVLDLSNNEVGVTGCTALLVAMGKGHLREVRLRSCHIHADGAEIIGKGLLGIALQKSIPEVVDIDLSGNPLGVLRGKKKKDGSKYSASRLKSTATATAASYMNLFKKGLKDVGMDTMLGVASADSDDEEEKLGGEDNQEEDESSSEFAKKRCGAKAMVNAFLKETDQGKQATASSKPCKMRLGLRGCFFDHGAADALAAMRVEAQDRYGAEISVDIVINPVLEDDMVDALHRDDPDDDRLREMAERHMDILQALNEAQERAAEARAMARARPNGMMWEDNDSADEDNEDPMYDDYQDEQDNDDSEDGYF